MYYIYTIIYAKLLNNLREGCNTTFFYGSKCDLSLCWRRFFAGLTPEGNGPMKKVCFF